MGVSRFSGVSNKVSDAGIGLIPHVREHENDFKLVEL